MDPERSASAPAVDKPNLPVLPPVLPLVALLLAIAGEWLLPLRFLQGFGVYGWQFWVGLIVLALGLGIGLSGNRAFHRAGTNANPLKPALKLVKTGPFRFTRNPMYWGFILLLAGLGLTFSLEWGLILSPLLWLALDRMIVAREEHYLAAKFGAPYAEYLRQTRRWL